MRTLQRVGAGLLALTLLTGLAACGDDEDDTGSGDEDAAATDEGEQAAGNDAFCDAVVEFNSAVFKVDVSEDSTEDEIKAVGKELGPLSQEITDEAPDSLSDSASELNDIVQALNEGDAGDFNAESTFEKYSQLVSGAVDECDYEPVKVTGVDYAYEGVPKTIQAGTVAFEFENAAETEDHMMGIIKKKDGVDLTWQELLELPEDEAEQSTEFLGDAFAPAGGSSSTLADLTPGDYAMICFIPVGSPDSEDGPPHFVEGMLQEFTVE